MFRMLVASISRDSSAEWKMAKTFVNKRERIYTQLASGDKDIRCKAGELEGVCGRGEVGFIRALAVT